jgi:putative DNA primase/helicase
MAKKVLDRAIALGIEDEHLMDLDDEFVKGCLDANERGDGVLYATLHKGRYLFNTTPKDGAWLRWTGTVWETDDFRDALRAVEAVALQYEQRALDLFAEASKLEEQGSKESADITLDMAKRYRKRVDRLRTENGAKKALTWAPVVETSMACRELEMDRQPMLLPCANGVIDLTTGVLLDGNPDDLLTKAIDVEYLGDADTTEWHQFVVEVCGSEEVAVFLKRYFGYAITGHSFEQYIAVFIGGGRNGKGVLFSGIAAVMGPYYHVISPSMITEQRFDPSPNAASEHKYALHGKRLVVAGESKRGQRIDAGQVKGLTGDDKVECRPNFGRAFVFDPTHTMALHTNHMPVGMGSEFSLVQRLLKIDFPWAYVDDPEAEAKKFPPMADRFRKKDKHLKDRLLANKEGILKWLVEGCLEWQQVGLSPPANIVKAADDLAKEEDYLSEFLTDSLLPADDPDRDISFQGLYQCFLWWWNINQGGDPKKAPKNRTLSAAMRERGYTLEKRGGKIYVLGVRYHPEITQAMISDDTPPHPGLS